MGNAYCINLFTLFTQQCRRKMYDYVKDKFPPTNILTLVDMVGIFFAYKHVQRVYTAFAMAAPRTDTTMPLFLLQSNVAQDLG